jgi:hypothetical protein
MPGRDSTAICVVDADDRDLSRHIAGMIKLKFGMPIKLMPSIDTELIEIAHEELPAVLIAIEHILSE